MGVQYPTGSRAGARLSPLDSSIHGSLSTQSEPALAIEIRGGRLWGLSAEDLCLLPLPQSPAPLVAQSPLGLATSGSARAGVRGAGGWPGNPPPPTSAAAAPPKP